MSKILPTWFRLIYHWCVKRHRSGLSLPFIIGVEGGSVEELLTEIANTALPEKIILKYCNDLSEYVLGLDESEHSITKHLKNIGELFIYDDILEKLGSLEKISTYLADLYKDEISNETYSKNLWKDIWEPYTEKDLEFIKEALS